jgi:hypothetical protein
LRAIHGALLESKWKELPLPPKRTEFHIDNPHLLHRKSGFSLRFARAKPYVDGESSLLLEEFSLPLSLLSTQKNDALALPFLGNNLKNSFILQLSRKEYNPSQRKLRKQYKGRKESIAKVKKKASQKQKRKQRQMAFFYHLPLPFYKAFFQAMSVYQPY